MRYLLTIVLAVTMFGVNVADPYRWLEDTQSARTQAWIDRQNARAEKVIGAYPERQAIVDRVRELALTGPSQFSPIVAGDTLYFMREVPPEPQPKLLASVWPSNAASVIADPARFGDAASIDFVWPSPTGRYVAIGVSQGGAESTTIHVLDTKTMTWFAEALAPCGGGTTGPAMAWNADERGFTYARLPSGGSQFNIKLYHHTLGTPQSTDALELGAISPIAEYELITSDDARQAAGLVQFGDGAPKSVYVREGSHWHLAVGPDADVVSGVYVGSRLFVVAAGDAPTGRIAQVGKNGTLTTIVAASDGWAYHSISPIRGGFLVEKSWGMRWRLDQYDDRGRFVRTVGLPSSGIGIGSVASSRSRDHAVIEYSGWAGPADRWVDYNATNGSMRTIFDVKIPSAEYARIEVHEITGISKDDTHVPVTVLSLPGTPQNGTAPAMLTGYGGFDLSTTPHFIGPYLAWLERGGVYASATLRGGAEYGEAWHHAGWKTNKQHVFDDFYAAARALVSTKWTNTKRLGIIGGSNGGLLVGAAMIQHPQAYGAVVGESGIYDSLRHRMFANGVYNESEYGSVRNPAEFKAIYAYSPYHHVTKGVAYPATLLTTSENDPRVASWQSWKFAAALEAGTSGSAPIIVLTHRTGGHGHGATFAQLVGTTSVALSFLAQQLGMK